jgi:hypothetical protein
MSRVEDPLGLGLAQGIVTKTEDRPVERMGVIQRPDKGQSDGCEEDSYGCDKQQLRSRKRLHMMIPHTIKA